MLLSIPLCLIESLPEKNSAKEWISILTAKITYIRDTYNKL